MIRSFTRSPSNLWAIAKMSIEDEYLQVCIWRYIGKFLGLIVRYRGIKIDEARVRAIKDMPPPKNLKELWGFQGHLAYIRRFISNLVGSCHPFSHLMKKGAPFEWDDSCQKAFDCIRRQLLSPQVLGALVLGNPSFFTLQHKNIHLGHYVPRKIHKEGKRPFTTWFAHCLELLNYSSIKKMCLALMFSV